MSNSEKKTSGFKRRVYRPALFFSTPLMVCVLGAYLAFKFDDGVRGAYVDAVANGLVFLLMPPLIVGVIVVVVRAVGWLWARTLR